VSMPRAAIRKLEWNYVPRNALGAYGRTLAHLRDSGFEFLTVAEFARAVLAGAPLAERACVFRVDVDSDPATAARMAAIAHAAGVRQSYYFRLCTLHVPSVRAIAAQGHEIGYHFEELAQFAYRNRLRSAEQVLLHLPEIREAFRRNMRRFRAVTGIGPETVASHGDFMNRKLKQTNSIVVDDAIREEFGLVCEAYDAAIKDRYDAYMIDGLDGWKPETPEAAVARGARRVRILAHPAGWRANLAWSLRFDTVRAWRELALRARAGSSG